MKTAIVIGATGLTGSILVQKLLKDSRFEKVIVLVRTTTDIQHERLEEHIVDFADTDRFKKIIQGDVLFSALGTTRAKAGSKAEQYRIDYTYQYNIARIAAANGVARYVLISSAGADAQSSFFYQKMKGSLEAEIKKLPFETIHIIQPGMLTGNRKEKRFGETIGLTLMRLLGGINALKPFAPIEASVVARAMISATFRQVVGIHNYGNKEIAQLAALTSK
jgi:uncharacterized protein YbjT (DUF2867 family)